MTYYRSTITSSFFVISMIDYQYTNSHSHLPPKHRQLHSFYLSLTPKPIRHRWLTQSQLRHW